MSKLPFFVSVPHAGRIIPEVVAEICLLSEEEIINDSDDGASEIYNIDRYVDHFITTDIARAVIDLNRAPDDIRTDGVIKTHTCQMVPIYRSSPDEDTIASLMNRYYYPYHQRLTEVADFKPLLGIDCHTMFEIGPPSSQDEGKERPYVCISNGEGTCPDQWVKQMIECFKKEFDGYVKWNNPFSGGYITRFHSKEMPWVQIEISRGAFAEPIVKHQKVLRALKQFTNSCF